MSMQDPIADMLTRIRNAHMRKHATTSVPHSNHKVAILEVLKNAGYINGYSILGETKKSVQIELKYFENQPVIGMIQRVSKASRRVYKSVDELKNRFKGGLGSAIVSTSKGVMTDNDAIAANLGGEVLFYISI